MSEAVEQAPDAALIAAVRLGDTTAYGLLYERHLGAAKRAAACLSATPAEREDLVAEAFTRVLQTLLSGNGPTEEFRPYLLVTMRHAAINAARRGPAFALYAEVPDTPTDDDPVAARLSGRDAASAFAGLPERWRMVLWHTEVEGESPATIAPMLGMTPNGVAALAYRAREGLRQAYLRMHLPPVDQRDCRAATDKLAGWVRRSISAPQRRKISAHLSRCPRCRQLAQGLTELNGELRGVLAPVVLGTSLAAAYLKVATAGAVSGGFGMASWVSWLSGVKATTVQAAAALAAVTAVTAVASGPAGIDGNGDAVAAPPPGGPGSSRTLADPGGPGRPATQGRPTVTAPDAAPVGMPDRTTRTPGTANGNKPTEKPNQTPAKPVHAHPAKPQLPPQSAAAAKTQPPRPQQHGRVR